MELRGKFTLISVQTREYKGKVYYDVNMEASDGNLLRVGAEPLVIGKMQKYQLYDGVFNVGSFNGKMYMRLVDVQTVQPVQSTLTI